MIKKLSVGEHHIWRALALESIEKHPECFVTTIEEERAIPLSWFEQNIDVRHVFVAGENQGLAVLRIDGNIGYITSVYVRATARRSGFGDALLNALRSSAIKERCKLISLYVFEDNLAARALYEKHGFVQEERTPFGDRFDCKLVLDLTGN